MIFAFVFEESATVHWNNEGKRLIDVYLAARGWREKPGGRRYLQALNAADIGFWEVVAVEPRRSIDVRPYGESRSREPVEKAGRESLASGTAAISPSRRGRRCRARGPSDSGSRNARRPS